ncbi:MAG: PKD domain-containing protein [Microbacterium sp.]
MCTGTFEEQLGKAMFVRSLSRRLTLVWSIIIAAAIVMASLVALPLSAQADTSPVEEDTPTTVTADSLPTAQVNGIVWSQAIVGDIVYAGGSFSTARPAGSAIGSDEVTRTNLIAYDITTGVMTSFAPTINGQVLSVAASPDGSRLYIGGDFTEIDGSKRNRIAAFDTATGALVSSFAPSVNASVRGVVATDSAVYFTGVFTQVAGNTRSKIAAVSSDGTLLSFAPVLDGGRGNAIQVSSDGTSVVAGGAFTTANGSSNPGYGLALFDAETGALEPTGVNDSVRNGGSAAAIWSLSSDGTSFYGTGYVYGSGGNLEGSFRADWATGDLVWVEDCHGDTYSSYATEDAVYVAGHSHYCGSIEGGFPQSSPSWTYYRGLAFTKDVVRTTPTGLNYGYADWSGTSAPGLLHWYPTFNTGSFSGASQGPWSVTGNGDYVVYAGEFTTVNGTAQQALSRFAVSSIATDTQGPRLGTSSWSPTITPLSAASLRVSWPLNWDRDNEYLTYSVYRNGNTTTPVYQTTARSKSSDWGLPGLSWIDTDVTAGSTYTYRLKATDPDGNSAWSATVSAVASGSGDLTTTDYSSTVLEDSPTYYWPMNEASGTTSYAWAGDADLTINTPAALGASGALDDTSATAASFTGESGSFASTTSAINGPNTFAIEAWFKTTSTSGGKIVGFGSSSTDTSSSYDRHVYMLADGTIAFGVYPAAEKTVQSTQSYNDGEWHHVVANLSADGMSLYVDDVEVASRTDVISGQLYTGYWRIGGDNSWSGSPWFDGSIDEVAIYGEPLSADQVESHYLAAGRTLVEAPTDEYGASVFDSNPTLYWRLDDAEGSTVADSSTSGIDGTIYGSSVTTGATGALADNTDEAMLFNGGQVISDTKFTNPTTFSLEAWFQTTSTTGGKIIGFGNGSTGNSSSYDRHIYMTAAGKLVFGTYTGSRQTVTSDESYNDGEWHHVAASLGSNGMVLYVDGEAVGTSTNTAAQNYAGYWHVGSDVNWDGSNAFVGTIDEVAVYPTVLSASVVAEHYALGSTGSPANVAPTASFTSDVAELSASVDASGSTDSDGTVDAYEWNWGDDSDLDSGATATHTYTAAGTYTITLTVTDDDGATATESKEVTVAATPNAAPVASFAPTVSALTVATDGSGSTDSDGTVEAYEWNWGDDSDLDSGATATHTYTTAGTYTITLTVTDDDGATGAVTQTVEVSAAAQTLVSDAFGRTATNSWGTADLGGTWTLSGSASSFSVTSGYGQISPAAGATRAAYLSDISATDANMTAQITLPSLPTGSSVYTSLLVRRVGTDYYRVRAVISTSGAVTLQLQRNSTTLSSKSISTLQLAAGDTLNLRVQAEGTTPTTLSTKAWVDGETEPDDWQVTTTDSTASLQTAGHVGVEVYAGSSVTNGPLAVRFDNVTVATVGTEAENVAPTAAFAHSESELSTSVDGSTSMDSDGAISTYDWNWGDNTENGSGVTTTHAYAAAGTYTVTLTVTDNDGATATSTDSVTVTDPESADVDELAADAFDRTATGSWGSADVGGVWTLSGTASQFSVSDGDGIIATTAGLTRTAYLNSVSSDSTDVTAQLSLDALPTGGSDYISVIARRANSTDYQARVVVTTAGAVQLQLRTGSTNLKTVTVSGLTLVGGEDLMVRVQAFGTDPTTIQAKVWESGTTEPTAWQATATDSTAALQTTGGIGVGLYVASGITGTQTLRVRNIDAIEVE